MSKHLMNFFNYHYLSFVVKDLFEDNQNKNNKIVKNINESLINLRSSINSEEIPDNENPNLLLNKSLTLITNKKVTDGHRTMLA